MNMTEDILPKRILELNQKQIKTLIDLQRIGVEEDSQVIEWCQHKIAQPKRKHRGRNRGLGRRKEGKSYYQGIIDWISKKLEEK